MSGPPSATQARRHRAELTREEKVEKERLEHVVPMMAEGDFVAPSSRATR